MSSTRRRASPTHSRHCARAHPEILIECSAGSLFRCRRHRWGGEPLEPEYRGDLTASHFGGTRQGLAISWPGHITDVGGIRSQFHHVIDIVPTILEATGIKAPEEVNGIKQKPIEGVSMAYTFDKANANAPSKHDTQYFEMFANRAIYHDGWVAATTPPVPPWVLGTAKLPDVSEYKWELYNIAADYSEYGDLAAKQPDKLNLSERGACSPASLTRISRVPSSEMNLKGKSEYAAGGSPNATRS
ncbi:MAG TPA: hypothetical protein VJX68_01045 [Candidatus Binatus sp.]|nr:hypothetical protein [Candidatus Binatus sp.]